LGKVPLPMTESVPLWISTDIKS